MPMKREQNLLDRSLSWVRAHLRATNLDVPDEFVAEWIFEKDDEEPRPAGFFFAVFAFGYMQEELLAGKLPATTPRSVPVARLLQHFEMWQMKLALAELHHRTLMQVDPMPLFQFPEGEQVNYWRGTEDMGPREESPPSDA